MTKNDATHDVLTIGNAIVDVIARCDEAFLQNYDIVKNAMNLIDRDRAELLYNAMDERTQASGGSAANTAAGVGALGGRGAYIGKVANDALGQFYGDDIRALGVTFSTPMLEGGATPTARSMIFVSPDGERSMNTYLGACVELGPDDVDHDLVAGSKVTYFEGYLWDPPRAKDAIRLCAEIAHQHGRETAITLSDSFCVGRYRDEFLGLIRSKTVDIVFANEAELLALYETDDFDQALEAMGRDCAHATITRSEKGAVVLKDGLQTNVSVMPVQMVDATGAGDGYAAGYLHGYTQGKDAEACAQLGCLAAGLVISQVGPRADAAVLKEKASKAGLL